MKIEVKKGKRKIEIEARKLSRLGWISGLMFRTRDTDNMLFDFGEIRFSIHSYFVFFTFLAIWLDKDDNVVDFHIVRPFTSIIRPRKKCSKLIEVPFNRNNNDIFRFFDGKGKI